MKKIKKALKYLLLPLTLIGFIVNFLMKANVKGARKDIESAEGFEKKTQDEINVLTKEENEAKIREERTKAKLEVIAESSDVDWYKKE